MSKYEIPFISLCISQFAKKFDMTLQASYAYLNAYKGIEFLIDFYDVEHLQSIEETIDDLVIMCKNNGGELV